jgi:hypothetical protein
MQHEEACLGVFVRLLSDWHGIPKGTVGSIDTVESRVDALWSFTIFWELHRPLPSPGKTRTRTGLQSGSLGLRLWEEDLPRFEVIRKEEKCATSVQVAPAADPVTLWLFSDQAEDQLALPFSDQELVDDDQPELIFASIGADAVSSQVGRFRWSG